MSLLYQYYHLNDTKDPRISTCDWQYRKDKLEKRGNKCFEVNCY